MSRVKLVAAGNVSEFAYNIDAVALVSFNGKLYATTNNSNLVYDITTGGNRTGKPQFASGRNFASLAVSNGKLYAGTNSSASQNPSAPIETGIWDISAGGSNWTIANSLAYGLPNTGDSLLTVVPNAQTVVTPPPVEPVTGIPEPGTGVVGLALVALGGLLRRRNWA